MLPKEMLSIYYDDNTNTFTDEYDNKEDSIVDIMTADDMVEAKRVGGTYYREIGNITYEIDFPIQDDKRLLYYDIAENVMYDEYGHTVFNIFSIISPNSLYMFKLKKETMDVPTIHGGWAELKWPNCQP